YMNCSNYYQLEALAEADRRPPEGKENGIARAEMLDARFGGGAGGRDLSAMKDVLRHHGSPSICRHGGDDQSWTEYSMIALCAERRALFLHGRPCEVEEYGEVQLW
ncbi:MAG: hypothetical protein ACP5KN_13970, partial [Armatimonadota bacterium]